MSLSEIYDSDLDEEVEIEILEDSENYSISQESLIDFIMRMEISEENERLERELEAELYRALAIRHRARLYIALICVLAVYLLFYEEPQAVVLTVVIGAVPVIVAVGYIPDHLTAACRCDFCTRRSRDPYY